MRKRSRGLEKGGKSFGRTARGIGGHIRTNMGLPDGTEVGKKQSYPSHKAGLKYVLHEIVPLGRYLTLLQASWHPGPFLESLSCLHSAKSSASHLHQAPESGNGRSGC